MLAIDLFVNCQETNDLHTRGLTSQSCSTINHYHTTTSFVIMNELFSNSINHFQVDICVSIFVCEILLYSVFIVLFVFLFPFLVCYQDLPIDEETRHLVLLPCVYELPSGPAAPTCSVSTSYKPTHMYSIDSFPSYNLLKFFLKEKIKTNNNTSRKY